MQEQSASTSATTSRAVRLESFGGPEVLNIREVPTPQAGPGQIRVRPDRLATAPGSHPAAVNAGWQAKAAPELYPRTEECSSLHGNDYPACEQKWQPDRG
jgi:hypothetical protein